MSKILVVDDKKSNRDLLKTLLSYVGHTITEASDGEEALIAANADEPDMILTDILMPNMDGFELVTALRSTEKFAKVPVVFYTATYHADQIRTFAKECGVLDVIDKPSKPQKILEIVNKALNSEVSDTSELPPEAFHHGHLNLVALKPSERIESVCARLSTLVDYALELSQDQDSASVYADLAGMVRDLGGARYAAVGVLDADSTMTVSVTCTDTGKNFPFTIPLPSPVTGYMAGMFRSCEPIRLDLSNGTLQSFGFPCGFPGVESAFACPVRSKSRTIGWIVGANKVGATEFTDADLQSVGLLGELSGRIISGTDLYTELRVYADELETEIESFKGIEALLSKKVRIASLNGAINNVRARDRDLEEYLIDVNLILKKYLDLSACELWLLDSSRERIQLGSRVGSFEALGFGSEIDGIRDLVEKGLKRGTPLRKEFEPAAPGNGSIGISISPEAPTALDFAGIPLDFEGKPVGMVCIYTDKGIVKESLEAINAVSNGIALNIHSRLSEIQRENIQTQFLEAQKMEAVGQLAGGIAHDFNNLITIIQGYTEELLYEYSDNDGLVEDLALIKQASESAAHLTKQLFTFARKEEATIEVIAMGDLITSLNTLLSRLIGADTQLTLDVAPNVGRARIDPRQIEQVLVNLVANARDALPAGGYIRISVKNFAVRQLEAAARFGLLAGDYILLSVQDNGEGMDQEAQARVFDPFYTTKAVGKGTGLGLSSVYGIVQQSAGYIEVESTIDQGTEFKLYFPMVNAETLATPKLLQKNEHLEHATANLLLAEDNVDIRLFVARILKRQGYTVQAASDGDQAFELFSGAEKPFDLVITDLIMPHTGGIELFQRIRDIDEEVPFLFISGYSDRTDALHSILASGATLMPKPFGHTELLLRIQLILGREKKMAVLDRVADGRSL